MFADIGKAIAAFERTLVSGDSSFDDFVENLRSGVQSKALNQSELRGLSVFVGKGKCIFCHSGSNFTDGEFHDLGLGVGNTMRVDPGRYGAIKLARNDPFNRIGGYADTVDASAPVNFISQKAAPLAQFKTPSLRQLEYTAPYMHDGRFATLCEVVEFYSSREGARPLDHSSPLIQALNLSEQEIVGLVSFLKSLSRAEAGIPHQE